jgi:hypothetical protein
MGLMVPCRICKGMMPFSIKTSVCDKPECQALKNKLAGTEIMPSVICKRKGCENKVPAGRKYYCTDDCRRAARKIRNLMELRYGLHSRHNNNRSADGRFASKPAGEA